MFSQKINFTALKESVVTGISNAHSYIRQEFKQLDFEKVVGGALRTCGYTYNLDTVSGNFSIIAASGYYIKATWTGEFYCVHIEINQSGVSASSVNRHDGLMISPFGMENYKSVFDEILVLLQKEAAKYQDAIKGDKGAKLLKSLIAPILRKNKLTGTKVESYYGDKTVSLLKKKVFGNVFFGTKITFNDYEDGINRMVMAFENLPNWIIDFDNVTINTKGPYHRRFNGIVGFGKGLGLINDPDSTTYSYSNLPVFDTATNHYDSQSKLSRELTELDYVYYVDADSTYNIFLQSDMLLCKNGNKVWVKKYLGQNLSNETNIVDEEFYVLLKILTWDCHGKGPHLKNDWWDCKSIPRLMKTSIENVLPGSVDEYNIYDEGIAIHYKNKWYMIGNENQHWLSLTEKIINYILKDLDLSDFMMFPGIEIIVKE